MLSFSLGTLLVRYIAEGEAKVGEFEAIAPEHLWMALTKLSDLPNDAIAALVEVGQAEKASLIEETENLRTWFVTANLPTTRLRRKLRFLLGKGQGAQSRLHRSPESVAVFEAAAQLAQAANEGIVTMLHLNQAILNQPSPKLAQLLYEKGEVGQSPKPMALELLGRDLTALAKQGELAPFIGRREELRRLAQILIRTRKGNALLVGEAGVGKTCLVEGLAQQMASPKCAPALQGKRIIELSMAALLAGASLRGDFEGRLEMIIREAETNPDLILFMDEFQTVMGQGIGGPSAADILKPALARGKLHLIGAVTTQDYERALAKDDAIARRFEILWIEEPSRNATIEMLNGLKSGLEAHYDLSISQEALEAAVDLALRYIPDRKLPDKALDLLDQTCAQKALESVSIKTTGPGGVSALQEKPGHIGREEIALVVAKRCRIPYEFLKQNEQERLKGLESFLAQRIIGQENALRQVSHTLQTAYKGLKDPRRPIASFLFAGPTGVGKTETAKALAEFLFGGRESLIRIDLSEYMEKHQVARLLGAPPGYIGYEEPGLLTSVLRQRPAAVVLFDEIEKAHPDVLNVLLQILDEGELTDGQGRKASFREAIVILTSNVLSEKEARTIRGFRPEKAADTPDALEQSGILEALRASLRPELLGRIKQIILFAPLSQDACLAIAEKVLTDVWARLQQGTAKLPAVPPAELRQRIREKVQASRFGARDIEHLVESETAAWMGS